MKESSTSPALFAKIDPRVRSMLAKHINKRSLKLGFWLEAAILEKLARDGYYDRREREAADS